jgi:hypothetical protein
MAMKKAELETHDAEYRDRLSKAKHAESAGQYNEALKAAVSAWEHVDGMMQFQSKYEEEKVDSVAAIDLVLKYAPLLLDFRKLDALEQFLSICRRIEKNTTAGPREKLSEARSKMWDNHRLWSYLEKHPDAPQDQLHKAMGQTNDWQSSIEAWVTMGVLRKAQEGPCYRLTTSMEARVPAKCSACGKSAEGPKGLLLTSVTCPKCRSKTTFVLLSPQRPRSRE